MKIFESQTAGNDIQTMIIEIISADSSMPTKTEGWSTLLGSETFVRGMSAKIESDVREFLSSSGNEHLRHQYTAEDIAIEIALIFRNIINKTKQGPKNPAQLIYQAKIQVLELLEKLREVEKAEPRPRKISLEKLIDRNGEYLYSDPFINHETPEDVAWLSQAINIAIRLTKGKKDSAQKKAIIDCFNFSTATLAEQTQTSKQNIHAAINDFKTLLHAILNGENPFIAARKIKEKYAAKKRPQP
ncbi:hypothetical protein HYV57_01930 [Candidatus Peregrinibacteria bacterium]|nr:hypothetical protein [Candidatus Peregrinibacteria bacterium]